ncbi:MAG: GTPase Era [Nitriliruptorales bacterium]
MPELDLDAILASEPEALPGDHRSGFVCLAGRPNVGKSTLLNAMVGSKVAIVTEVPGTTRNAIRGVVTRDDLQLVFVDTPGVTKPRTLLNRRLNELVAQTWSTVDVVCLLVDAAAGVGRGDAYIAEELREVGSPVICVVNKEDRASKDDVLVAINELTELGDWAEIVPTSAVTGFNVEHLVEVLAGYVPEGPRYFPRGVVTDQPERQLIAELIRERFITRVFEEVPHSIAVVIDEIEVEEADEEGLPPLTRIDASIFVERESQKGIVIGRGGRVLKEANTQARHELEGLLGTKVFLDVRVKVAKEWQSDPRRLERFGY